MSPISPRLLQKLGRSRLLAGSLGVASGAGERRSREKGVGIEFEDHRPYEPGDDVRHLDRHAFGRSGKPYVKQFTAFGQLSVAVIIDDSGSMKYGSPQKSGFAKSIAMGLAHVVLVGGDKVALGVVAGKTAWHDPVQGAARLASLASWLERQRSGSHGHLPDAMLNVLPHLMRGGVTIVVSDWLFEGVADVLAALQQAGQQIIMIHLLAPEELAPARLGAGAAALIDAETGEEIHVALESTYFDQYLSALETWAEHLAQLAGRYEAWYQRVHTDEDLEHLFVRRWRQEGLIR
jgi:uncharacterized protein (DUF58 family)